MTGRCPLIIVRGVMSSENVSAQTAHALGALGLIDDWTLGRSGWNAARTEQGIDSVKFKSRRYAADKHNKPPLNS